MTQLLARGAVKQALDAFYRHTPKAVVHFNVGCSLPAVGAQIPYVATSSGSPANTPTLKPWSVSYFMDPRSPPGYYWWQWQHSC